MQKKSKRKVKSGSPDRRPERRVPPADSRLDDFGLEPPKIYRESQRVKSDVQQRRVEHQQPNKRVSREEQRRPLTRAEKRVKDSKKRKKRNKLRRILIWMATIVLFIGVGTALSLTVFFHINNITVSGETQYSKKEILAQCTVDKGENLFMSDIVKAKRTIERNLPYIYNAELKRKLPDTIEIIVTQADPKYSIKSKDKTYIILDDNFKVLEVGSQKSAGISITKAQVNTATPGKTIEFKNDKVGECIKLISQVVKDNDINEITGIYSKSVAENFVVYDDRITFKLGNCDDLEAKIFKGLTACDQLNKSNPNAKGTMTISGGKEIYFTEE